LKPPSAEIEQYSIWKFTKTQLATSNLKVVAGLCLETKMILKSHLTWSN
jgi:hypothetical protein